MCQSRDLLIHVLIKSCEFKKIEKNEFRAVIKYFYMKGNTPKKIKAELDEVHGTSPPSFKPVLNWVNKFKRVRTSTRDEPRSGRRVEAATPEIIEKVHNRIFNNRRVGKSHDTIITILHEKLSGKKLSAGWVARLLTIRNKRNRVTDSMTGLALFHRHPSEFLRRYITVDESWIHFYTPETKGYSK